ncbi:MAG: carboxymuconolactone decarboxylase family protein [Phycisphaerales bacterium JB061]
MVQRFDYTQHSRKLFEKYMAFSNALSAGSIEQGIRDLVNIRVSQVNHCAFCVDMHVKEARMHGERELRLYHLPIWRESTLFSERERAALMWAEALTTLTHNGVASEVYDLVREELSVQEVSDLTFCVMAMNGWNRLNAAGCNEPGSMDEALGLTAAKLA